MPPETVAVALSGGVDSSVAAAILKREGYQVIGLTLWLTDDSDIPQKAEHIAKILSIPHYIIDCRDTFYQKVITDFCRQYSCGRTPNPCIICNRYIKFGVMKDKAGELGASLLATGHYARVSASTEGYHLLKAADSLKDQSYFLYRLNQKILKRVLFPIGNLRKLQVLKIADELGLTEDTVAESQDICFIPGNDYRTFIAGHITLKNGDIVDTNGDILGSHKGLPLYTIGQRQGLGISSRKPLYVVELDAEKNRLIVGNEDKLLCQKLVACNLSWLSGKAPPNLEPIAARIRARAPESPVRLKLCTNTTEVHFLKRQRAIAPGQSVVFYHGQTVLGGGIIKTSYRTA
jgi:tRNA-specific 2-thiouridylase